MVLVVRVGIQGIRLLQGARNVIEGARFRGEGLGSSRVQGTGFGIFGYLHASDGSARRGGREREYGVADAVGERSAVKERVLREIDRRGGQ